VPKPIVSYDSDLPEISNHNPFKPPEYHLRKKEGTRDQYEIVEGRRPSKILAVNRLREAVSDWRQNDYPGCSHVTARLFNYWFFEDHLVDDRSFRYYFAQREAVETLVYLVEIEKIRDAKVLIDRFAEVFYPDGTQRRLLETDLIHQTTMDGKRQIRRYIPEVGSETVQDLPSENLRRYAFKMATGSGKTVVMAMLIVWSFFHRRKVKDSDLSTNFLVVAPNVIVYQRLEKDFANNNIFYTLPLIPPEWKGEWDLKVILRGEGTEPNRSGNLFLTNIQQLYAFHEKKWTPDNAVEALLGPKPSKDLGSQERSMLERVKSLHELVVINDEAHHVHDEDLEWYKTLIGIHEALPGSLSLWLDFSATPKDQNGTYFPWIICDYPLAQAVEDRIVKAPIILQKVKREDPDKVTKDNLIDSYGEWIVAALERWKEHYKVYKRLGHKPVLFIMTEKNSFADEIGKWLVETKQFNLKKHEVLVIHTDKEGEITKADLEKAREAARDIDKPENKIKVIVSVLMLREGWDVRNVTVILGLRPFTSKAKILPEQAVGRGLRLMVGISPDRTQTLEVLGTRAFEEFVRELEKEGVGIKTTTKPPAPPVEVRPVQEKAAYDIAIPLTRPAYTRNYRRLEELAPLELKPIYEIDELEEPLRIKLKMEFATTGHEIGQVNIDAAAVLPLVGDLIAAITNKVINMAKLGGGFAQLYPIVRDYISHRCFGQTIDLNDEKIQAHLRSVILQEGIAKYLARKIGQLTAEKREIVLENYDYKLSKTQPFVWRRNLPLLDCSKTIFNLVATYNDYEKEFARFLEHCDDIIRFASLGTTEQESGTRFKVDYIKPNGAIGFYYPDFVAVQETKEGEVNWIIETKGRVWEDTHIKDAAITEWCKKVTVQTGSTWRYLRVDQSLFGQGNFPSFASLVTHIYSQAK